MSLILCLVTRNQPAKHLVLTLILALSFPALAVTPPIAKSPPLPDAYLACTRGFGGGEC